MSDDAPIHECESEIVHYTGHYVPYSLQRVCGFFNVPQIYYMCKGYGLSSLSEKTRKSNHLQMLLHRLNLTIILLKGNALQVSESVKTPINSSACWVNVVGVVMKNSANITSCNIVRFYCVLAHDLKVLAPDSSYLTHSKINTSLWPHWDYCPLRSKDAICQCAQHLYQQYTGQPSKIGVVLLHFCFVYKANNINNNFCKHSNRYW